MQNAYLRLFLTSVEKKIPFFWLADEADDDSDTAAYRRDRGREAADQASDDASDSSSRPARPVIPIPHLTIIREHDELRVDWSRPKEFIRFKGIHTHLRSLRVVIILMTAIL